MIALFLFSHWLTWLSVDGYRTLCTLNRLGGVIKKFAAIPIDPVADSVDFLKNSCALQPIGAGLTPEIETTMLQLEKETVPSTVDFRSKSLVKKFNGLWKTLATSLPLTRIDRFSNMTMVKLGHDIDDIPVKVTDVLQYANITSGIYENYIMFTAFVGKRVVKEIKGGLAVKGRVSVSDNPAHSNRLIVQFIANELVPLSYCYQCGAAAVNQTAYEVDRKELRKALKIKAKQSTTYPMPMLGWVDLTYFSKGGSVRIMRGNNNNSFVLEKLKSVVEP